jgi:hypothetical protein
MEKGVEKNRENGPTLPTVDEGISSDEKRFHLETAKYF